MSDELEKQALRNELLTLKDNEGKYVISSLGVTTPLPMEALLDFIAALIKSETDKARLNEITELVLASNSYGADLSYSSDMTGFYVVERRDVAKRLVELQKPKDHHPIFEVPVASGTPTNTGELTTTGTHQTHKERRQYRTKNRKPEDKAVV